jgi:hypothetical protein
MHYTAYSLVTNNRQCDGEETRRLEVLVGFIFRLASLCLSCCVNIYFPNFYFVFSYLKTLWDLIFLHVYISFPSVHANILHFSSIIILFTLFLTDYNYVLFKKK